MRFTPFKKKKLGILADIYSVLSLVVGLYYCFSNLSDARIFIIMYGVTSMYFSAVMVRYVAVPFNITHC